MHSSSLADAPIGRYLRIHHLRSTPEISNRLRELGFCENSLVRLMHHHDRRMICEIMNSRIGISSRVAREILVSPCDEEPDPVKSASLHSVLGRSRNVVSLAGQPV